MASDPSDTGQVPRNGTPTDPSDGSSALDPEEAAIYVDSVSLAVAPGEVVGLLGPNGAGKADTAVRDLSRGMKQKVSLASVLAGDVSVAFLDETAEDPLAGFEAKGYRITARGVDHAVLADLRERHAMPWIGEFVEGYV